MTEVTYDDKLQTILYDNGEVKHFIPVQAIASWSALLNCTYEEAFHAIINEPDSDGTTDFTVLYEALGKGEQGTDEERDAKARLLEGTGTVPDEIVQIIDEQPLDTMKQEFTKVVIEAANPPVLPDVEEPLIDPNQLAIDFDS